jgi:hypothetical protein
LSKSAVIVKRIVLKRITFIGPIEKILKPGGAPAGSALGLIGETVPLSVIAVFAKKIASCEVPGVALSAK